jgi:hypothetical protein
MNKKSMKEIVCGIILTGVMVCVIVGTSYAGNKTCEDKCADVGTDHMSKCKGVEQCEEFVKQEYRACVRACNNHE